jgi:hypothetical protein
MPGSVSNTVLGSPEKAATLSRAAARATSGRCRSSSAPRRRARARSDRRRRCTPWGAVALHGAHLCARRRPREGLTAIPGLDAQVEGVLAAVRVAAEHLPIAADRRDARLTLRHDAVAQRRAGAAGARRADSRDVGQAVAGVDGGEGQGGRRRCADTVRIHGHRPDGRATEAGRHLVPRQRRDRDGGRGVRADAEGRHGDGRDTEAHRDRDALSDGTRDLQGLRVGGIHPVERQETTPPSVPAGTGVAWRRTAPRAGRTPTRSCGRTRATDRRRSPRRLRTAAAHRWERRSPGRRPAPNTSRRSGHPRGRRNP